MKLALNLLRRDGGTQPRAHINFDVAYEYGEEMKSGAAFPPAVVFYDGAEYWLADGFHRAEGAFSVEITEIECEVHQGTREDAQWYSFGVNKSHGLRRTNEDKQRAVKAALAHPKAAGMSDAQIALHVGVARETICRYRPTCENVTSRPRVRTGADGRTINTANIGKRKPEPAFNGGTCVTTEAPRQPQPAPEQPPATRNTGLRQTESEPERDWVSEITAAVWAILNCEKTPAELAAQIKTSNSAEVLKTWEDASEFLNEIIRQARA